jgi:hypothetical protein
MSMSGAPDPLYVAARRVLLDALDGIRDHLDALVLVGAQAVYMHAQGIDIGIAPMTTDGDLAIDPTRLGPEPLLEVALAEAGLSRQRDVVGIWQKSIDVEGTSRPIQVDLLVPDSIGGPGRRGARLPPHAKNIARKVIGLEGALVDRDLHLITALDANDSRSVEMAVAGPAALIVAKVHKIQERVNDRDRLTDKDALDVYRLLRAVPTAELTRRFRGLREDPLSRAVAEQALQGLPGLFGARRRPGVLMATRATGAFEASETVAASLVTLTDDLLKEL